MAPDTQKPKNVFKNCIDSILDYALDIAERRIEQSGNVGDIILIGGESIVLTPMVVTVIQCR